MELLDEAIGTLFVAGVVDDDARASGGEGAGNGGAETC